jgi:hypothetical protein
METAGNTVSEIVPTLAAIIDRLNADVLVDAADVGEGQAFPFTL